MTILEKINKSQLKDNIPSFHIGDTVIVHVTIIEGDKERIQVFKGTVIARDHGDINETFTVRRLIEGLGVERVFPLHSPRISNIEVVSQGDVRRAKLYYLRRQIGKKARVKQKIRTT